MTGAKKSLCTRNPPPEPRWPESTNHRGAYPAKKSFAHRRPGRRRKAQAAACLCRECRDRGWDCDAAFRTQAHFFSAVHGPARPISPLAPFSPCTLSLWQIPARCLAITSSSLHHYGPANPSPWMVAVETGRGQIYFLIFIPSLSYIMAIFAEPKHRALNDRANPFVFLSPSLSFSYWGPPSLFWFQAAIHALTVKESNGEKSIKIYIFLPFHLCLSAGHPATICSGANI